MEMEIVKNLKFCNCGQPELAYQALLWALEAHEVKKDGNRDENWKVKVERNNQWTEKTGKENAHLLLYFMDLQGLTEHGGSVLGAWLSVDGENLLQFLRENGTDPEKWDEEI